MEGPSGSSSLTDEEIEAFLATRPWRDHDASSEEGQAMTEIVDHHAWTLPSSSMSAALTGDDGLPTDWTSRTPTMEWESRSSAQMLDRSLSSPSSFEAQFLAGTPEQDMLLRALAEQQQHQRRQQEQQQQQHQHTTNTSFLMTPAQRAAHDEQRRFQAGESSRPSARSASQTQPMAGTFSSLPIHSQAPSGLATPVQVPGSHQLPLRSPQSDVFSSPDEPRHQMAYPSSHVSQGSLQSLQEQGLPLSLTSSPSYETSSSRSPTDMRIGRRSSTEIRALQQRRQVRRTYAGPSPISSIYSPSASLIEVASSTRGVGSSGRPMSASGPRNRAFEPSGRPRAGTTSTATSLSSAQSLTNDEHNAAFSTSASTGPGGIPSSLSAELAGLGLDVDNFYAGQDVYMHEETGEEDTSMQRTSSSSSASTTKRRTEAGDYSLFSQGTTASSGLDDSILSTNDPSTSRWIHGRDTPPSTPPRGTFGPSPSPADYLRKGKEALSHSHDMLLPTQSAGMQYPSTWPRSVSAASSAAAVATPSSSSSTQGTPSMSSSSGFVGTEATIPRVHSPIHHSHSDNPVLASRLSPQMRVRRTPSSSSSISQQQEPRRTRPTSRLFATLEVGNPSSESLRSDAGPSRLPRIAAGMGSNDTTKAKERSKRWSTSILPTASLDAVMAGRRRAGGRLPEPDQYEQVSAALETLRTFLRQRDRPSGHVIAPRRSAPSRSTTLAAMSPAVEDSGAMLGSTDNSAASSPLQDAHSNASTPARNRTLRHPPSGPLPPRGSIQSQTTHQGSRTISPGSSTGLDAQLRAGSNASWPSVQSRSRDRGPTHSSSPSVDRIAALEDLAERVRLMRDMDQQLRRQD